LPPEYASEAPDPRTTKVNARPLAVRPRLVTGGRGAQHALRLDEGAAQTAGIERARHHFRILDPDASVYERGRAIERAAHTSPARAISKRVLDILGAALLGLVFAPLMIVIGLLLRNDGGRIIYRHRRVGRGGQTFECLKFRTMVPDADRVLRELLESDDELKAEWVQDHKLRNDPRITGIGRFLRRTSLDELPQIWNVMRGEMSLVGPRPVVREELMRYGRCLPIYLSAKPGITGLWQVTGRNDTDYRRRVALDVYYVRKQNLLLDLYILLKTTRVVLGGGGAY
jgi:exopolysaccharide production protein ExoY